MRAVDLAEPFPTVSLDTDALVAARMIGEARLPGLIVCDDDGSPHTVLGGSQVLRFMIPRYVQDDPTLARVYDEALRGAAGQARQPRRSGTCCRSGRTVTTSRWSTWTPPRWRSPP